MAEHDAIRRALDDYGWSIAAQELLPAARAQLDALLARLGRALELLERVVIKNGAGDWSDAERDRWASDYKDVLVGFAGSRSEQALLGVAQERVKHLEGALAAAIKLAEDWHTAAYGMELPRFAEERDRIKGLLAGKETPDDL